MSEGKKENRENDLEWKKFELDDFVKRKELELRESESKKQNWMWPLYLTIVGGIISLVTGIITSNLSNEAQIQLEKEQLRSQLVLKAVDGNDEEQKIRNLKFFNSLGLLDLDSKLMRDIENKKIPLPNLTGEPASGEGIFRANCNSCHGLDTSSSAYPMTEAFKKVPDKNWFVNWINNPNVVKATKGNGKTHLPFNLSPCDADKLYEYLANLNKPTITHQSSPANEK